jgi:anti-sigma factor RsiW
MNCQEAKSLRELYQDSELEASTSLELDRHLQCCPECARRFAAETQWETHLSTALHQGSKTEELWTRIEQSLDRAPERPRTASARSRPAGEFSVVISWWRAWLWPNPQFYVGLAAVWVVMWVVNWTTQEPRLMVKAQAAPMTSETRTALTEQRRELAELLDLSVASLSELKPQGSPPHSERQRREKGMKPQALVTPGDLSALV